MKLLHTPSWFGWSRFDEARNLDFNSVLWRSGSGNLVVDPLPLSPHDFAHLSALGGAQWIVITNSDHVRDAETLRRETGAKLAGPAAERSNLGVTCDAYLTSGSELLEGCEVVALEGSKTPGELALIIEETTLVTGDLIRCHLAGRLHLLPDPKLTDKRAAVASLAQLAAREALETVLVGDGWPTFGVGHQALRALLEEHT